MAFCQRLAFRAFLPGHPDVVAIHATRATDAVPFLPEIQEHATYAAARDAPAGGTEVFEDNVAPTRVRFVLAVTGGFGGIGGNGSGVGAASRVEEDTASDGQRTVSTKAEDMKNIGFTGEDRGGRRAGEKAAAAAAAAGTPRFYTVEGRPDAAMLKREVPDIADRHVLLCGPGLFMTAMEEAMKELGVPSFRIHSEEFSF